MNLDLLYSTLIKVFGQFDLDKISPKILDSVSSINNLSSAPQNAQHQLSFAKSKEILFSALSPKEFQNLTEFDVEVLQQSNLDSILPGKVLAELKQIDETNELTPSVAASKYKEVSEKFSEALSNAKDLHKTLKNIGAEDLFDYNEAYLAFVMNSPDFDDSYKEYVDDQRKFETSLRLILNGANIEDKSVKLIALSNTDPVTIIGASTAGIFLTCKILQTIMKTIQDGKKIELLQAQIDTEGLKSEKLEAELKSYNEERETKAIANISQSVIGEGDGEKLTSLEKGIRGLLQILGKGHSVEIIIGEYDTAHDSSIEENDVSSDYLSKEQHERLVELSKEVRNLTGREIPKYLLEAPKKTLPNPAD